jgi:signal transduction histidine kinase
MQEYFRTHIYSIVAGFSLAIHLIINWRQLIDWRNSAPRAGALELRRFLMCLVVFFSTDVLWGTFEALRIRPILYADTVLFFLMMALSVFFWSRFIVAYLELRGPSRAIVLSTGRGLLAFFVVALAANVFNGWFFTIDAESQYAAGPLRQVALLLLAAFGVFGAGMTLFRVRRVAGSLRRRYKMVMAFGVTMAVAIVLQLMDPFLPLYGLGCLFGVCFLHVFVVEDERDEMHSNELLARQYEAQLEAERSANQAKSLFFSTVSHDIRTPLNAIVGFSDLLGGGVDDPADRLRYVSAIRASSKVLARLVDDILDLSKLESGKLELIEEPTDVPALVREVIDACQVAWSRKSLDLKSDIAAMPWVSVDPQRIRQLLFNMLSNAFKYTAFGTITVRVRWHAGKLELAVSDTGKGISQEDIARILQPFVQLADRNHRDGTGLGLAICQKLANLMGGKLEVASKVGVGSTFTVTLPGIQTVEPPAAGPAGEAESGGKPAHLLSRVLVADDSPVNRAVLKAMLAKCGVEGVAMAANGREALALLKDGAPFDLVLTDLWMPEMDGQELVRAIRADPALAALPVYLVTADVEARKDAESNGFTGLLLKPITLERLQALFA